MKKTFLVGLVLVTASCGEGPAPEAGGSATSAAAAASLFQGGPPPEASGRRVPYLGEYAAGPDTLSILEDGGEIFVQPWGGEREVFDSVRADGRSVTAMLLPEEPGEADLASLNIESLTLRGRTFQRLSLGGEEGETFQIEPLRPPAELREEALAATPPEEEGDFLPSDLVELVTLDPTILLDVRYAGTNNFMGEVFYSSPRAFLQRPAAEGVVRANTWLKELGYGLLVHDGYRPWYVTKMFWDATPEELKVFVADPASGSRHNRGCAVDLTLYDLETGEPVIMPGGFDEMSARSYVDFAGGTSRQRWFRDLLRTAMEAQGFTVYDAEWWHFDYESWSRYRLQNLTFEEIGEG